MADEAQDRDQPSLAECGSGFLTKLVRYSVLREQVHGQPMRHRPGLTQTSRRSSLDDGVDRAVRDTRHPGGRDVRVELVFCRPGGADGQDHDLSNVGRHLGRGDLPGPLAQTLRNARHPEQGR